METRALLKPKSHDSLHSSSDPCWWPMKQSRAGFWLKAKDFLCEIIARAEIHGTEPTDQMPLKVTNSKGILIKWHGSQFNIQCQIAQNTSVVWEMKKGINYTQFLYPGIFKKKVGPGL